MEIRNKKNKKFALVSILTAVLLAALFAPAPASAEIAVEAYTADVTLLGMEYIGDGSWRLYLGIPDPDVPKSAAPGSAGPNDDDPQADFVLNVQCPFFNSSSQRVTPDEFFTENDRKVINIEFLEYENSPGDYVVTMCLGK